MTALPTTIPTHHARPRIGLALSGGGFRASIFHLGVIRRLEELGVMQDVSVISTVSGGSIIGAYYVLEMEKRLREHRARFQKLEQEEHTGKIEPDSLHTTVVAARVKVFEEIAEAFFKALDENLRSRAILFSPFHHPVLFLRSWWPTFSRSDIIQSEYDRVFFHGHPLDQLPSVTDGRQPGDYLDGPTLVINATSLLTGERKGFSRVPLSGVSEMSRPNTNVLPLSRVVGASAGVPGLFPPTPILGDIFVDGGVSDNQGLDGLLDDGRKPPVASWGPDPGVRSEHAPQDYDAIIVSDASGQMEPIHRIKDRAAAVLPRTFSVFQHELRNKTIRRLMAWRRGEEWTKAGPACDRVPPGTDTPADETTDAAPSGPEYPGKVQRREFAYVHLYLNLKERTSAATSEDIRVTHRVPSEYIQAIARFRTDLDQFSYVEREALMYHGYTTIDAQLRRWCRGLLSRYQSRGRSYPALQEPPLFAQASAKPGAGSAAAGPTDVNRGKVLKELRAGAQPLFLRRTLLKYRLAATGVYMLTWLLPMVLVMLALRYTNAAGWVDRTLGSSLRGWWESSAPRRAYEFFQWLGGSVKLPLSTKGVFVILTLALAGYFFLWVTFGITRWLASRWDRKAYAALTGREPTAAWK